MERSGTWVFTINNFKPADIERLTALDTERYLVVFGEEVGEQGTPHLQGYLSSTIRMRRAQVEKVLGGHAWCEVTHDEQSAIGYSIKDGVIHCNRKIHVKIEEALRYGREYRWLGSVWYNSEDCEEYEPCEAYYKMWKWNESCKK